MHRTALLALVAVAFAVTTLIRAEDAKSEAATFTVKCVLSGTETDGRSEAVVNETSLIKEAEATDIPIWNRFRQEDGVTIGVVGYRNCVPSPALLSDVKPDSDCEYVEMGARLNLRIRSVRDGRLLLDAILSDTVSPEHDPQEGILIATTRQRRWVKPVRIGQPVTLSWPVLEEEKTKRQVTITVLSRK